MDAEQPERMATVAAWARSGVVLRPEDGIIELQDVPLGDRRVTVRIFSRFDRLSDGSLAPRELVGRVTGPCTELEETIDRFSNLVNSLFGVVALGMNTSIEEAETRAGFEHPTAQVAGRFAQVIGDELSGLPMTSKWLRVQPTIDLLKAIAVHAERERLQRAVEQYRLALRYWSTGFEVLSLAHLFMAAETLKVAALREVLRTEATPDLVKRWAVRTDEAGNARRGDIEAAARLHCVFHGDATTHDSARDASDEFEHGYAEFREIFDKAHAVREATADHLRRAIIEIANVGDPSRTTLLSPPLTVPTSPIRPRYVLQANLTGQGDPLGVEADLPYPHFVGEPAVALASGGDGSGIKVSFNGEARAVLATGFEFHDVGVGHFSGPDPLGQIRHHAPEPTEPDAGTAAH